MKKKLKIKPKGISIESSKDRKKTTTKQGTINQQKKLWLYNLNLSMIYKKRIKKKLMQAKQTNQQTNGRTDGWTDSQIKRPVY